MYNLLCTERIVLESLKSSEKNISQLCLDTELPPTIIGNVLTALMKKNIVATNEQENIFTLKTKKRPALEISKDEINDLLTHVKTSILIQKVWPTPMQELMIRNKFLEIRDLLRKVEKENIHRPPKILGQKKVYFLAEENYGDLIKSMVN